MKQYNFIDKLRFFSKNKTGSETTEKVGWILGAAILVGIGVLMLNEKAPTAFRSIFDQATESIEMISGPSNDGGGVPSGYIEDPYDIWVDPVCP